MELRIYDQNLDRIGVVEEFRGLLWTRKYYEPGNFSVTLPLTDRNIDYVRRGRIISKEDTKEAGVVEYVQMSDTIGKKSMVVKGRFLSSYFDRRVITGTHTFSGRSEEVMRQLISEVEPIPRVELGTLKGYTDTIKKQTTYKNLLKVESDIAQQSGHGFILRPDFTEKKLYFEVYDGVDRSYSQNDRSRVIFNEEYMNLNEVISTETDSLYKTIAYVGGEGEGDERIFVTVGDTSGSGLARREVFIDAKDVRKEDGMTDQEYLDLLRKTGEARLAKNYPFSDSIESTINPMSNFKYKTDYDLGDIISVEKESWGLKMNLRITEIKEQYIGGGMQVIPTFGDPIPLTNWRIDDE